MKRLFYTDEKVDNRVFQRFLGFQPSDGWLLIDEHAYEVVVFLDGRYFGKSCQSEKGIWKIEKILLDKPIVPLLQERGIRNEMLILEKSIPWGIAEMLQGTEEGFTCSFDDAHRQRGVRMHKSSGDIAHIQQAISLTEEIWSWIEVLALEGVLLGKTELEVRGMIVQKAYTLGLEGESFDTIVATGKNTAIPHHTAGRTVIEPGAFLLDMGFRREGRCSDFTRSLWIPGREEDKELYDTILTLTQQAHDRARDTVRIGTPFKTIDQVARDVISEGGYGNYFVHATGHGVGLDVHEAPSVSSRSSDSIERGMVFTIEPGIYLPGKFGVRWENIVIID